MANRLWTAAVRHGPGAWRSLVAHLLWGQRVACSNHAAPTILAVKEGTHARAHLQAREKRDAVWPCPHKDVGARVRAGASARDRSSDGLDKLHRHAPTAAARVRYGRGSRRLRA